jgi:hypothetical protein
MSLIDELASDADGMVVIWDWLGSGGVPVNQSLADKRALTCLCCPENHRARWWESVKTWVSDLILKTIEIKNRLHLRVDNEGELGMCNKCRCPICTKVWTPISHIASNLSVENENKLPNHCWIRREINTP